jgi:hypothetical protein
MSNQAAPCLERTHTRTPNPGRSAAYCSRKHPTYTIARPLSGCAITATGNTTSDLLCMECPKWDGSLSYAAPRPESPRPLFSARNPRSDNIRAVPLTPGFLGSPFPPRSRPGWPASGSGNSPVPWSKTWLDAVLHEERYGRR